MEEPMVWLRASVDDDAILREIEQTDRAAALIAVAYLEERLLAAICARLVRNAKAEAGLFGRSRPISTLSSRIDLGALIGVYGDEMRRRLHTIREIRNEFAHKPQPRDFNFQKIRMLCENIAFEARIQIDNEAENLHFKLAFIPDGTPRSMFMNAIKYLLWLLDMETKQIPLRTPVPPMFQEAWIVKVKPAAP
jgi:hypothetical protein